MREFAEHEKNFVRQVYMYYLVNPIEYLWNFSDRRIVFMTYRWKRQIDKERSKKHGHTD